ncbi:MAG: hypothetical protein ACLS7Z_03740 [Christensenellales bacterium]
MTRWRRWNQCAADEERPLQARALPAPMAPGRFADYRSMCWATTCGGLINAAARFDKYLIKLFIDESRAQLRPIWIRPPMGFELERASRRCGWPPRWAICRCATWTACPSGCCRHAPHRAVPRISGRESFLRGRVGWTRRNSRGDRPVCVHPELNPGADDGVTFILSDLLTDEATGGGGRSAAEPPPRVMLVRCSPAELDPQLSGGTPSATRRDGRAQVPPDDGR